MKVTTGEPPRMLDAEFDISFSREQTHITIHSRGGSRARGQVNPDYEVLVQTLLERLRDSEAVLEEVLLASRTVVNLPRPQRRIEVEGFTLPVEMVAVPDITDFRLAIRRAVVRSHSASSNATHGNATKKIELVVACGLNPGEFVQSLTSGELQSEWTTQPVEPTYREGRRVLRAHYRRERNRTLVKNAKAQFKETHGRLFCEVCQFDFVEKYGAPGEGFIEAHHEDPLGETEGETETKVEDLKMVCANCHRMLHKTDENGKLVSIEHLKSLISS